MEINHSSSLDNFLKKEKTFNLNEIDIYTQYEFEVLKKEKFKSNLDYYICIVEEVKATYLFDGEMFVKNYLTNPSALNNPISKKPIEDFEVYRYGLKSNQAERFTDKLGIDKKKTSALILGNSQLIEDEDKAYLWLEYAKAIKGTDPDLSIEAYITAAKLGNLAAQVDLFNNYRDTNNYKGAAFWIDEIVKQTPNDLNHIAAAADAHLRNGDYEIYYNYCERNAKKGNLAAVVQIIEAIEKGVIKKELSQLQKWRKILPDKLQKLSTEDLFSHLRAIGYRYDSIGYPTKKGKNNYR
ncbi:MAG: hypothetical protein AAGE99_01275 [Chlamydiota bacterium]